MDFVDREQSNVPFADHFQKLGLRNRSGVTYSRRYLPAIIPSCLAKWVVRSSDELIKVASMPRAFNT